jgi:hypothetical protein
MKLLGFHVPGTRDTDAEVRELKAEIERLRNELAQKEAALAQKDAELRNARLQKPPAAPAKPTPAPDPEHTVAREPGPAQDLSPKLTIELVPQTCWLSNVRNHVTKPEWDLIGKSVYKAAGYRCEVCSGKGAQHPVECHEIFAFDDQTRVQKLIRMVALCPACHRVKHYGFARTQGLEPQAFAHLCKVNHWTQQVGERYVNQQFAIWRERSQHEWSVDLSLLQRDYGITVQEESAADRTERADAFYREKLDEHHRRPRGGYDLD